MQETVHVNLGQRSYDIQIGSENLEEIGPLAAAISGAKRAIVITDDNVHQPHAVAAAQSLAEEDIDTDVIKIEAGEESKSADMAVGLWNALGELEADRQSLVVAVGGGVVGDLAGFIAATYMRGLRFFQVPTSLLAQVDSSVGGKTGINLPEAKNMVGAFWQPIGVLIDTATLKTLPQREYLSGLAEVVKYGMILDAEFFDDLEGHVSALRDCDEEVLAKVVARCCRLKADVVEQDEFERTGLRAVLNYGHTYGHAFEALCGYGTLLHGEAVAIGMACAARLAVRLGRIDAVTADRQNQLLADLGLPLTPPQIDPQAVLDSMMHDKKVAHGRLRFVLPSRVGHCDLVSDIATEDVLAALQE